MLWAGPPRLTWHGGLADRVSSVQTLPGRRRDSAELDGLSPHSSAKEAMAYLLNAMTPLERGCQDVMDSTI